MKIAEGFDAAIQLMLILSSGMAEVIHFLLFLHSDALLVLVLLLEVGVIS
jgi:hypothetical protein